MAGSNSLKSCKRYMNRHPLSRRKIKLVGFLCFAFCLWVVTFLFVSSFIGWVLRVDPSLARQWGHSHQDRLLHFEWKKPDLEEFRREYLILWMAPFWSKSGYGSEAVSFVLDLEKRIPERVMVWQYGDKHHLDSLEPQLSKTLERYRDRVNTKWESPVVSICHATPYTWFPVQRIHRVCPSPNSVISIGRTMFESNSVPHSWVAKLKRMDQIWVPTKFHIETFTAAGVPREKLVAIPEAIDSNEFDPSKPQPPFVFPDAFNDAEFIFVSIFKWEARKGWKYLVQAFSEEFENEPQIKLFLLTHGPTLKEDPMKDIVDHLDGDPGRAHNIHLSGRRLTNTELPSLYKSAGAFVLSSHGEGWGRPVVEAMSMALPVIATNWSGPSEYLTDDNSFPLQINKKLIPIDASMGGDDVEGHLWAEPSISHLKYLMRYIVNHPDEAKRKGKQARKDMVEKYNTTLVSELLSKQLELLVGSFVTRTSEQLYGPNITQD